MTRQDNSWWCYEKRFDKSLQKQCGDIDSSIVDVATMIRHRHCDVMRCSKNFLPTLLSSNLTVVIKEVWSRIESSTVGSTQK
jgi:hypothetical protein